MKIDDIKGIIKLVADANLHKVELEQQDIKIRLIRTAQQQYAQPMADNRNTAVEELQQAMATNKSEAASASAGSGVDSVTGDSIITIKSTMIGIYCAAPAKDKAPFVRPGKEVKAGEPMCGIKALSLLNEVEAAVSGTIEEVLVKDGDAVEYDQPLFVMKVRNN